MSDERPRKGYEQDGRIPKQWRVSESIKKEFGLRVQRRLDQLGISQAALGRNIGAAKDDISRYVRGESLPASYRKLSDLARALGVTVSYLVPAMDEDRSDLRAAMREGHEPEMKLLESGRAFLQVAAEISVDAAIQIMKILEDEKKKR